MIRWSKWYSCSRKAGKDLKSSVSGFIKRLFCFESGHRFHGPDKKWLEGFGWKGFGRNLFHGKILTIMWCRRKLSILLCLGCGWGEERRERQSDKERQNERILKSMVAQGEFFSYPFSILTLFSFSMTSPVIMKFDKNQDVVLYYWFSKWPQILLFFGLFCSVWVWLGWLGKYWMCVWSLTYGRKLRSDRHLIWFIVYVRIIFFSRLRSVSSMYCLLQSLHEMQYMSAWEVVSLFIRFVMFVRFLIVCDLVCMIGIPNLVSLL